MNWRLLNQKLIDQLKHEGAIRTKPVERAFRVVPRHLFVPHESPETAYRNQVIGLKLDGHGVTISSLSQPSMIAIMLEQLGLKPGQRVLEVGAGTGYNAALMAAIVGKSGHVVTLDIDDDLVQNTTANLAAANVQNVTAITRDGGFGYAERAPYDRIILTTSAYDIAPAWVDQLADRGRLLLPLIIVPDVQYAIAFDKHPDLLQSVSHYRCRFVTLRGQYRTPDQGRWHINADTYLSRTATAPPVSQQQLAAWLDSDPIAHAMPVHADFGAILHGLELWLLTHLPHTYTLLSRQNPPPFRALMVTNEPAQSSSLAHILADGMALLSRHSQHHDDTAPLVVSQYGPDPAAAHAMWQSIKAWDALHQPTERNLQFGLVRRAITTTEPRYTVLPKQDFTLIIHWQPSKN